MKKCKNFLTRWNNENLSLRKMLETRRGTVFLSEFWLFQIYLECVAILSWHIELSLGLAMNIWTRLIWVSLSGKNKIVLELKEIFPPKINSIVKSGSLRYKFSNFDFVKCYPVCHRMHLNLFSKFYSCLFVCFPIINKMLATDRTVSYTQSPGLINFGIYIFK